MADLKMLLAGGIQLLVSLGVGVIFVFAAFNFFKRLTRNIDEMKELSTNNISVALLSASIIFSIVYIVHASLGPAVDTLKQTIDSVGVTLWDYLKTAAIMLSHIVIGLQMLEEKIQTSQQTQPHQTPNQGVVPP